MEKHKDQSVHDHLSRITKSHAKLVAALNLLGVTLTSDEQDEEKRVGADSVDSADSERFERVDNQSLPSLTPVTSDSARPTSPTPTDAGIDDGGPSSSSRENRICGTKRRRSDAIDLDEQQTGTGMEKPQLEDVTGTEAAKSRDHTEADPASPSAECKNRSEGRAVRRRTSSDWNEGRSNGDFAVE